MITKERRAEYTRRYRTKLSPEKAAEQAAQRSAYYKEWYARRAPEVAAQWRAREKENAQVRRSSPQGRVTSLLTNAKSRAEKRGLEFAITLADLELPTHCPVLGLEIDYGRPAPGSKGLAHNRASVDRMDNSRGYVKGNVRVISLRANTLKRDATADELRQILQYVELCELTS